jgi:hypothetical protein
VVSCSDQGDVWSIKRLEGQACRTSLLVHVALLQGISPAVGPRLKDPTTIVHLTFLRSSSHFHSVLIWMWVSELESAAICVLVRLSVVHMARGAASVKYM